METQDPINELVELGARRWREMQAEAEAKAQARAQAEQDVLTEQWAPVKAAIFLAVPPEARQYLSFPDHVAPVGRNGRNYYSNAIVLALPGCVPIGCHKIHAVFFAVAEPRLEQAEDTGLWFVNQCDYALAWEGENGMYDDLAVAVYIARQRQAVAETLQAEAEARNAQQIAGAEAEPQGPIIETLDGHVVSAGSRPDPCYVLAQALHDFMVYQGFQY